MTFIKNQVAYIVKSPLSAQDFLPFTAGETASGVAVGQTVTTPFGALQSFVLSGLDPETGGLLKITEIEYEGVLTDIAEVANALSPAYTVARYECLYIRVNGQLYLLKLQNVTIGFEQDEVDDSDFIEFSVSGAGINTILHGSGVPASDLGNDGDFYIDTTGFLIYGAKSSGVWGSGTSMLGTDGTNGTNGTDGADGLNGADGKGFVTPVAWSNATAYVNNATTISVVTYQGSSYACILSNTNQLPTNTTYWTLIAQKGDTGAPPPNQQKTISGNYTLVSVDDQYTIFVDSASDIDITVDASLPDAFLAFFYRCGTGEVTFVEDGVTINTPVGLLIKDQNCTSMLEKKGATAVYQLSGSTKV